VWVGPCEGVELFVLPKHDENAVYPVIIGERDGKGGFTGPEGYVSLDEQFMAKVGGECVAVNEDGTMAIYAGGYAV
jgi:hypothetical protein